jgi:hypothetical protein
VSRRLRQERRYAPVGTRCDVCKGEGLLELAPLPDGRLACPVCRHQRHVKPTPGPYDREREGDDWSAPLSEPRCPHCGELERNCDCEVVVVPGPEAEP